MPHTPSQNFRMNRFFLPSVARLPDNSRLMQTAPICDAVPNLPPPSAGHLQVIRGCMFAGKTEALIDRVLIAPGLRIRVFKHRSDDRYHGTKVVSHRRRSCPAIAVADAEELLGLVRDDVEFVAIDEGHFFDDAFPAMCRRLATQGRNVLVTALDSDCRRRRPFPMIVRLCELADEVTSKSAICARCGQRATFTQRLTPIIDGRMVGGAESFEPRCARCWTPPPEAYDQITRFASKTGPCVQQSS